MPKEKKERRVVKINGKILRCAFDGMTKSQINDWIYKNKANLGYKTDSVKLVREVRYGEGVE